MIGSPQSEQPILMLGNFRPRDRGAPFLGPKPSFGDEPAKISIARMALDEKQNRGTVVDGYLGSDNELNPDFLSFEMRPNDAVNPVPIRDGK